MLKHKVHTCTYLIGVLISLADSPSAKPLRCAHSLSVTISLFTNLLHSWDTMSREGRAGPGSSRGREEMNWQAQVVRLYTFGTSKSHRHFVVIHQHTCWNVSPSLYIVTVGTQFMHGCFSLVHAEGRWLALQRHAHTHVSLDVMNMHWPLPFKRLALLEDCQLRSPCLTPLPCPKSGNSNNITTCCSVKICPVAKSMKSVYCWN